MTAPATTLTTANTSSWILIRLVSMTSAPLIEVIGDNQRVAGVVRAARGARAGHLADGAAPLQLELGQVALEPGTGEKGCVQPAQRQVDDGRQVRVVAAHPFAECARGEWEGSVEIQGAGQRRPSIRQRLQHRAQVLELFDQILLGLIDRVSGKRAESAQVTERIGERVPLV